MGKVLELLEEVAGTGELITICYAGGSKPGRVRQVVVSSIADNRVRMVEPPGRLPKLFIISKIRWAKKSSGESVEEPTVILEPEDTFPVFQTLQEYVDAFGPGYEKAGWHLHVEEGSFGVGAYFKNGNPKKTPSVLISWSDPTLGVLVFDGVDFYHAEKELTGRERPWSVRSWRQPQCKTYGKLVSAMKFFHSEVLLSHPKTAFTTSYHR